MRGAEAALDADDLSTGEVIDSVGRSRIANILTWLSCAYAGGSNLARLIDSPYLKSYRISELIARVSSPVKFVNPSQAPPAEPEA